MWSLAAQLSAAQTMGDSEPGKLDTFLYDELPKLLLTLNFCPYSMFRQGMHDLKVWPNVEADGSEPTRTPGRTSSTLSEDQMSRLAKVHRLLRQNSDWCESVDLDIGNPVSCLFSV